MNWHRVLDLIVFSRGFLRFRCLPGFRDDPFLPNSFPLQGKTTAVHYLWTPSAGHKRSATGMSAGPAALQSMKHLAASAMHSLRLECRYRTNLICFADLSSAIQGERAIREEADSPQLDNPAVIPSCFVPLQRTRGLSEGRVVLRKRQLALRRSPRTSDRNNHVFDASIRASGHLSTQFLDFYSTSEHYAGCPRRRSIQ